METDRDMFGLFTLENGFPDEYYAFTDGELSATVERGGGINTIVMNIAMMNVKNESMNDYPGT